MASAAQIIAALSTVIKEAVDIGPTVIKLVSDAEPFAQQIFNMFNGTQITQAQLDALVADAKSLSDQLMAPLPPDDGTTTT